MRAIIAAFAIVLGIAVPIGISTEAEGQQPAFHGLYLGFGDARGIEWVIGTDNALYHRVPARHEYTDGKKPEPGMPLVPLTAPDPQTVITMYAEGLEGIATNSLKKSLAALEAHEAIPKKVNGSVAHAGVIDKHGNIWVINTNIPKGQNNVFFITADTANTPGLGVKIHPVAGWLGTIAAGGYPPSAANGNQDSRWVGGIGTDGTTFYYRKGVKRNTSGTGW